MLISILDRWLTCKVPSLPLDAVSYPLPCLISIYHRLLETFDSLLCLCFCCCSSLQTSLVSLVFLPCLVILPCSLLVSWLVPLMKMTPLFLPVLSLLHLHWVSCCLWGCWWLLLMLVVVVAFLWLFLLWVVWSLWMGLPEILSSPALVVLRVSSLLLLVLLVCPLVHWHRALHPRSFLIFPPLTSFDDLPFWLVCWLTFVLVLSWTVSLPRLRRVWWHLSVLMLLVLLLTLPLLFLLLWRLLWWLVWMI